ncbi:hypothetical protein TEA_001200 [Camellia sinensis var. sinensis]|uniref:DUF668 domain-containing protein n=1 Tax=Camellia sinensis var. sinensis TaxID=542762 RepID=A0A4S4EPY5_CAMSN|nr:hypothetical protein TEA_001200 [Camellia sinensis var. sinensis]
MTSVWIKIRLLESLSQSYWESKISSNPKSIEARLLLGLDSNFHMMEGNTVTESWFSNLWRISPKSVVSETENSMIGILAFEVASLMSKLVNLWQFLSNKQIVRLKKEIVNSLGIKKLVSDDANYLMDLVLAEIIQNLGYVAKAVARLGKRCKAPVYHRLGHIFDVPITNNLKWCQWEYNLKKFERKVKKMGRFVSVTAQLYQEVELLAELEKSLRRMRVQSSVDSSGVKLFEFQQKITRQRKEVKRLREMSPWVRTYDYSVRLLLRSVFTIVGRINHVFGVKRLASVEAYSNSAHINSECLLRSYSVSARMHTIVHPFENMPPRFDSRSIGSSISNWELSGNEIRSKNKPPLSKTRVPFKGCLMAGNESPLPHSCMQMRCGSQRSTYAFSNSIDKTKDRYAVPLSRSNLIHTKLTLFISNRNLLNAPPSTLGAAALALHYANVIILIEKITSSHHSVFLDARDDLYDMLPTNIKISLMAKLKLFAKTSASSVYDAALAAEMSSTLARILEWLAPLAHNMIRWHSERNFEQQRIVPGTNVLLVQTLHFANEVKTEDAIIELLMSLSYMSSVLPYQKRFDTTRQLTEIVKSSVTG